MLRASINATERVAADATCDGEASYNQIPKQKNVLEINIESYEHFDNLFKKLSKPTAKDIST